MFQSLDTCLITMRFTLTYTEKSNFLAQRTLCYFSKSHQSIIMDSNGFVKNTNIKVEYLILNYY